LNNETTKNYRKTFRVFFSRSSIASRKNVYSSFSHFCFQRVFFFRSALEALAMVQRKKKKLTQLKFRLLRNFTLAAFIFGVCGLSIRRCGHKEAERN
jgi:hypothetical protein